MVWDMRRLRVFCWPWLGLGSEVTSAVSGLDSGAGLSSEVASFRAEELPVLAGVLAHRRDPDPRSSVSTHSGPR